MTTNPSTPSQICWLMAPPINIAMPRTKTPAAAKVRIRATRSMELPRRVETNLGSSWASACSICSSRRSSSSESGTASSRDERFPLTSLGRPATTR